MPLRSVTAPRLAARALAAVLALTLATMASAAFALTPAPAHLPQTPRVDTTPQVVDLTFPVADPTNQVSFIDDFLQLRGGGTRLHAATDVMAPKHRPVHAVVGGTITSAPFPEPSYGWMVSIRGDDGRRYAYIHLNNDTPARDAAGRWLDDDKGGVEHAYAPRIVEAIRTKGTARGLRIERGELIGWNGDSGNAKGVAPHLHLEIHVTDATGEYRINPYHSLVAALARGDVPGNPTLAVGGRFTDVTPGGTHSGAITRMAEAGIVTGCGLQTYCPSLAVTRGDLAAYLTAALQLPAGGTPRFSDVPAGSRNAAAIAAVDRAGIMTGYTDGRFGPSDPLSRAQLATMLVKGFTLPPASRPAPFTDVLPSNVHAANIAAAHQAQLTNGCEDGTRYCGTRSVTRGQIATFLEAGLRTR